MHNWWPTQEPKDQERRRAAVFTTELQFFMDNQDRLVAEYGEGRTLVIKGEEVVSSHDTPLSAYLEASERFEPGTFMIQPCRHGPEAYTVTLSAQ